ncbi:hypothetical protein ACQ4PT_065425 [Festuca glaucescens]
MANYPLLPFHFLTGPVTFKASAADRLQRNLVVVTDPPLQQEEYAIIVVNPEIEDIEKEAMLAKVPPLNVTPHPYALPFLNEAQQHHLDLQIWQQQNADLAWEGAVNQVQEGEQGWGEWPEMAAVNLIDPDFQGTSLRSATGYDGESMLDGMVPDNNPTDDPATWSPVSESEAELSDIEAAADRLMAGQSGGELMFIRVSQMEITEVVEDVLNINTMVPTSILMQGTLVGLKAAIRFLLSSVYTYGPCLIKAKCDEILGHPFSLPEEDTFEGVIRKFNHFGRLLFAAVLRRSLDPRSILDIAEKLAVKQVVFPAYDGWVVPLLFVQLDEEGQILWVEPVELPMMSSTDQSESSSLGTVSLGLLDDASSLAPHRRGKAKKADTPLTVSEVKRCTRNNKEGYRYMCLPNGPTVRKASKVKKAVAPAILQIKEMQRLGVEHCNIDPEDLSEERLLKDRQD